MPRGWRIGRIGGIDIRIDPSWPIIALLITFNLWAQFADRARFTGTSMLVSFLLAFATSALFFLSVLAHELAHAGVCRLRGIPVAGITLIFFGGATEAKIESRGPADEFLVTGAGPLTSIAVGGLFLGLRAVGTGGGESDIEIMLRYLGGVNILLGLFNLLPGFPLDGGRLLRSVVWRVTGSLARATRVAARCGQVVGGLMIAAGLAFTLRTSEITYLWTALIGWFLFRAASEALVDTERRLMMERTMVSEVMAPPPPTIPADLSVGEAVDRYLEGHDGEAFPVIDDGRVAGLVSLRTVDGVASDRPVRDAMVDTGGAIEAAPDDRLDRVTAQLGESRGQAVLVMDGGRLVGVIEPEDLDRYFRKPTPSSPELPDRPDR
jgi:Zn-dependent protease/predicted transcriptional regulator